MIAVKRGQWTMRNGHTAVVQRSRTFAARRLKDGGATTIKVWFGRCENCNEPCSWNANGSYAASGRHSFDIVSEASSG